MIIRKVLLCVPLVLATAFVSAPATARSYVEIEVAPPAVREEVVPGPRHGYAWAPGYWEWRGHQHYWVRGHWVRERHGHHWEPAHWVEYGHHWRFVPGVWVRD